ncbi:DUF1883 domain-containing protein [Amycolatopsis sp. NPDC004169]|uniref:DUF1883 domain-containing protein n=1 Tax=Amycolatopsis sp. NPDC004169 TaxID=3154453 RepID=UPI0033B7FC93
MEHLWHEIGSCAGGARFELTLRGCAARICLMDAEDYQAYRDEDEDGYQCYYGGFWETSPVELVLPYDGFWYLVIDSYPGRIKYWLTGPY